MILNSRMSGTGIPECIFSFGDLSSGNRDGDYARSSRAAHDAVTGSLGSQVSTMGALIFIIFRREPYGSS